MTPKLVYIVGDSATGKSTAASAMTRNLTATQRNKPFAHVEYRHRDDGQDGPIKAIKLGEWRPDGYTGADSIDKARARELAEWVGRSKAPLVIGEGRKFGYPAWFDMATNAGADLKIVHLGASDATRKRFQAARHKTTGRKPTVGTTAAKGMSTEAENLRIRYHAPTITVDGQTPDQIADQIASKTGTKAALGL